MKLIKLTELFDVYQGVQINKVLLSEKPSKGYVKYLRPTNKIRRLISAYISPEICSEYNVKIFKGEYIVVGTNGQGSHTYSYVIDDHFSANGNLAVLVPKVPMTTEIKNLYAYYITMNRKLFSYGRIPQGERLKAIKIPAIECLPAWAYLDRPDETDELKQSLTKVEQSLINYKPSTKNISLVPLSSIFNIEKSEKLSLEKQIKQASGIRYIAKSGQNNGVVAHVLENINQKKFEPLKITIALVGSVLSSFVQDVPFYCAERMAILTPKKEMSEIELLAYAYFLNLNKRFYSYGRPADTSLSQIKVPDLKSLPDWLKLFS